MDARYTGPTKSITLAEARQLGAGWAVQPKIDGCMARVVLNSRGVAAHAFTRQGHPIGPALLRGIIGAELGRPHAELVGELEAYTEASLAAVAARGYPLFHAFDLLHDGTRSLVREPYAARRDALWRMQSTVECRGPRPAPARAPDGRYTEPRRLGWQVAPIVPQSPLAQLDARWAEVVDGDLEGLVLVNLAAPAGARSAKAKLKPHDTLDCRAVAVGARHVTCLWAGQAFVAARGRHYVEPGNTVAVRHSGWVGHQTPRWPVVAGVRRDLLI